MDDNSTHSKTDELLNVGMSFDSKDECRKDRNLFGRSRRGEDGKEDNMATPKVHQHGGDVNPFLKLKKQ
jgi:hypothetical protein